MYNRELQTINTQEKAYLLGLFYADGNIGLNEVQSRLALNSKDKELLLKLKDLFPFFYTHWKEDKTQIEIGNYEKELKEDFISNGCLPRKSYENRDALHIPIMETSLIPHFIRGYFDGDGGCTVSYYKNTKKKTQKRVYIYSVSKYLIFEISDCLKNANIENTITKYIPKKGNMYVYKINISAISYKDFYNYMYNSATIYMNRKKCKFQDILDNTNFFTPKSTPNCKFCNSTNVVCDGWNYYKVKRQNYLCRECGRHFSAPLNSNIQSDEDELLED